MRTVMTVTGPTPADSLGFCQCHEHLMITNGVSALQNPDLCIDDVLKSAAEVSRYLQAGGKTLVDAQPGGCSRNERALFQIAKQTGCHIIASTGFHKLVFYPGEHWIRTSSSAELAQIFIHELQKGMYTYIDNVFHPAFTSIRAGIIKTALDTEGLTPVYRRLFTAAAGASIDTNVPVMVHIEQGSDPAGLLEFLRREGLEGNRLLFCHMDRNIQPLSFYTQILRQGTFLEFDTIGRFKYHGDGEEAQLIRQLIDLGYEDQLLISLDTTRARLNAYTADAIGLTYILHTFLGTLRTYGITEDQIHKLTHTNCVRAFAGP